jgi:hypothetical protein
MTLVGMHEPSRQMTLLRAGATLCIAFGSWSLGFIIIMQWPFQRQTYTVVRKEFDAHANQFRIFSEVFPGGPSLDAPYSRRFYELAQPGDTTRIRFADYAELWRGGHIIKRYISPEILFGLLVCLAAFIPAILFARLQTFSQHRAVRVCLGVFELLVIIYFLFGLLMPC